MNILAFDSSTTRCVVGLAARDQRYTFDAEAGNQHSQLLLPAVQSLMTQAGLDFAALDAVAFGAGPGSFTGVRIACACAQGLAFAHGKPVVPVGTLEALAYTFSTAFLTPAPTYGAISAQDSLWVINDARMGEIYVAQYARDGEQWVEKVAPQVQKPAFALEVATTPSALAGDAFAAIDLLAPLRPRVATAFLNADGLLQAARIAYSAGRGIAPADAQPLYVRDKVALTEAERAAK